LVKRLADALVDRDHISAVIRGIAVDGDHDAGGAGANGTGARAIARAMALAGVLPGDISYVEVSPAPTDALRHLAGAAPSRRWRFGSVAGGLRHLGPVAGMAGFVKTVLALDREQLPPTINVTAPDPRPGLWPTPLRVQDRLTSWPRDPGRPRHAAVSSMGFGGSTVHVVLEEPPAYAYGLHAEEPRVVVWSGLTGDAERAARLPLARFFTSRGEVMFADAVATLQHGRSTHRIRAAAVCTSAYDAATVLRESDATRIRVGGAAATPRPVTLVFPGQGSQPVRAAHGLHRAAPAFAAALDDWLDLLECEDVRLRSSWLDTADGSDVTDPVVSRPLLFAVEAALARGWQDAGVRPAALLGHGIGALVAATVAGILTPADASRLVHATVGALREVLATVAPAPPSIPVHSAATGRPITPEDAVDPDFWATQLFAPVASGTPPAAEEGVLVEVGPAGADVTSLLTTAARLWTEGHDIAWERLGQAPLSRRVPLPGYAYQRTRLTIDAPAGTTSWAGDTLDMVAGPA
jgi:acyl transferase domain-containing protein